MPKLPMTPRAKARRKDARVDAREKTKRPMTPRAIARRKDTRVTARRENRPPKTLSPSDQVRLGPAAAAGKLSMKRSEWAKIVKNAHARGFSVTGALSGNPDALKERSVDGLKKQAQELVNTAYAPRQQELHYDEQRIKALDDKRSADNRHYSEWLATQQNKLQTSAIAADGQLDTALSKTRNETLAASAQLQRQAQTNMESTAGTVSEAEGSTAARMTALNSATGNALQAIDQSSVLRGASTANLRRALHASTYLGQMAASDAKRQGETNAALRDVSERRTTLAAESASDSIKEQTRLRDQQIEVAATNREFGAAASKLGIDAAEIRVEKIKANRKYRIEKIKARDDRRNDRSTVAEDRKERRRKVRVDLENARNNRETARNNRAKTEETARNNRERVRVSELAARNAKSRGDTAAEQKNSSTIYKQVETTHANLVAMHAGKGDPATFRRKLIKAGASSVHVDLAEDLRKNNGKLSPRGRMKAKSLGMKDPTDYWGHA